MSDSKENFKKPNGEPIEVKPKPEPLPERLDVFGLFFDSKDGRFYPDQKADVPVSPYTFERGEVRNTAGQAFLINPTQFATESTRAALIQWLKQELAVKGLTDATPHDNNILNAFYRTVPERQIELHFGDKILVINAGLLANSIIRGGAERALSGLIDSLNG